MFKQLNKFFFEVKSELQKATWPWDPKEKGIKKYKELIDSTVVVLIATVLLAGYIAIADFVLLNVMKLLTEGWNPPS